MRLLDWIWSLNWDRGVESSLLGLEDSVLLGVRIYSGVDELPLRISESATMAFAGR